ncbi:MAG: tetratricopeptide repeat protein [Desulfobacterales bacterium]|nr:tetratricopeptide repeat protein [Desulfobacterales bacterium]
MLHRSVCLIIFTGFVSLLACNSEEKLKMAYFEKGKLYFQNGKYKNAEIEFKNAIKISHDYVDAHINLAETYLKLGKINEAFKTYETIIAINPKNTNAQVKLAKFYLFEKKNNEAKIKIESVLQIEPDNIDALFLLGNIYASENDFKEAEVIFKKITSLNETNIQYYIYLAGILSQQDKFDEAENILKKAIKIFPASSKPHIVLFHLYFHKKKFDLAENEIKKAISKEPENDEFYIVLADFYFMRGNNAKAESIYKNAIEISPNKTKPYLVLAAFYTALGNNEKAFEIYNEANQRLSGDIEIIEAIANFYIRNGNSDKASMYIDKIKNKWPHSPIYKFIEIDIHILNKNYEAAIKIADELIAAYPFLPRAYYSKGIAYIGLNDKKNAKLYLEKALEFSCRHIKAKIILAQLYLDDGELKKAQNQCMEVLELVPSNYQAKLILANSYMCSGMFEKANELFDSLIEQYPTNPELYLRKGLLYKIQNMNDIANANFNKVVIYSYSENYFSNSIIAMPNIEFTIGISRCDNVSDNLKDMPIKSINFDNLRGQIYLAQKNFSMAEKLFNKALSVDKTLLEPYFGITKIYLLKMNEAEVIDHFKNYMVNHPFDPSSYVFLGNLYSNKDNFNIAEDYYRKSLSINSNFIPAIYCLSYVLMKQDKNLDEAINAGLTALKYYPNNPAVIETIGWIYFKRNEFDNAVEQFQKCVSMLPKIPEFHYALGMALLKKGDKSLAKAEFTVSLSLDPSFDKNEEIKNILLQLF